MDGHHKEKPMLIDDRTLSTAEKLRDRFADSVVTPADDAYDPARASFNVLHDQRPDAIATPSSAAETAAIVSAARDAGLRITAQGSSHNVAPLGSLEGTLLIKLERMKAVELNAGDGTVRVEAGARWWDLIDEASAQGLAARHGSSPEINIVGYSVGGGVGWMVRKHGLQANAVTAIEIVTADGEVRTVDAGNEPELFWAVRGGGGNFGVVTAIEFELVPVHEFHAGSLFFEFERAEEILKAYREWTVDLPDEVTSVGRTLQLPDLDVIPEIVRGKSFSIIEAASLSGRDETRELLAPLRELNPIMDTFANVPPAALAHLHMDPQEPVPYDATHALLGEFTERAIDEALAAVGPGAGSPVFFEVRHVGGAAARSDAGHGAIDTLRGEYMMFGLAPMMDPAMAPKLADDLGRLSDAFAPDDAGRYLNFTEVEHPVEDMFPDGTVPRLKAVKPTYDPEGLFRANHAV
jgi:UDP-N-acetylenolpyruvoylglucosamine reductase